MNTNNYDFTWEQIPEAKWPFFRTITAAHDTTGSFHASNFPSGHQKMSGLQERAFFSGYPTTHRPVVDEITGIGEVILVRSENTTGKAYAYPVGSGESGGYLGAQFRHFSGHHFANTGSVPVNKFFGHIPWPSGSSSWR